MKRLLGSAELINNILPPPLREVEEGAVFGRLECLSSTCDVLGTLLINVGSLIATAIVNMFVSVYVSVCFH